ncbi:MAG TPA: hypothetical protein VF516_05435, partial [Kofleriaceae bacterium]
HAEIITSPRQARHALSYVLSNWRRHQEDLRAPMSGWTIDWFSSAVMFSGWAEYGDGRFCGAALQPTTHSWCTNPEPGC